VPVDGTNCPFIPSVSRMSTHEFEGKVVLVTGASRGIGKAVAEQFAGAGARVAVHYNSNRAPAERVKASLPGGPHLLIQADMENPDNARGLVETVVQEMGRLDVLVNNAGIFDLHPPHQAEYEQWKSAWDRTIAVNLTSPAHLSFFAARQMMKQGGGSIVNISSRGAFRGEPEAPAYGASKAGLNALGQSMARALAPYNIAIHSLAPGWVETDMAAPLLAGPEGPAILAQSPLNRVGRPEEMARIVLFLASERSQYMTGCIIDANGASYLRS
jgi:NAD(P)-dependent dehydrogenase (short-subunit alcohol dehydrogenase family)